jgi:hypothetical protein
MNYASIYLDALLVFILCSHYRWMATRRYVPTKTLLRLEKGEPKEQARNRLPLQTPRDKKGWRPSVE